MPLIPQLDLEAKIQTGDKTRFDASKSFKTKDVTHDILAVLIAPGDAEGVDVLDEDDATEKSKWWLDWVWPDWKWDLDGSLSKIYFTENGVAKEATVADGTYTLAALAAAIEAAMNAAGDLTYTLEVNDFGRLVISVDAGKVGFKIRNKPDALLSILGLGSKDIDEKTEHVGAIIETARRKVVVTLQAGGEEVEDEESKTFYVDVFKPETDYLFSADQDLIAREPDVMSRVYPGRASHLNLHRRAQTEILEWMDRQGYRDTDGKKLDKWSVTDRDQVRAWSAALVLKFLFAAAADAIDDVNMEKANEYDKEAIEARNRALLELALTKDSREKGTTDKSLSPNSWTGSIFRR